MPLAYDDAISANSESETDICSWTADGVKELCGFLACGDVPAEYRLYVDTDLVYVFKTTDEGDTAQVVDKPWAPEGDAVIDLRVYHKAGAAATFNGTILGG